MAETKDKKKDKKHAFEVTTRELAAILRLSDRRIRQFVDQGMPRIAHGQFNLADVAYWLFMQWGIAQRAREKEDPSTLQAEQERLTKIRADREALELSRLRREVMPIEVYRQRMVTMIIPSRTRLLEAPRALCRNLDKHPAVTFNAATIHIIRQTAETVIREALTELATKPEEARN